jgi:E3 ubiquitin-protein ligase SIAH1
MAPSNVTKSASQIEMDLKKKLHNEFHEFLVCQNCTVIPKEGPIYTCDSGKHATCNECFQISKVCKCKLQIKNRSDVLEKVRTTLPLACKFRKNGCNAVLSLESLLYHEVDCQWRPIFCPILDCKSNDTKIIFNLLDTHLTEHHTDLLVTDESLRVGIVNRFTKEYLNGKEAVMLPNKLSLYGAQFFREIVLVNKRVYIWIYYQGSKEEAKNYICTIKVYGGSENEEFFYNGPPRSLDESKDEVIDGDYGLSMSLSQVKRIVSEGKMRYSIKISCPKEEARDEDVESGISDNENTSS